MANQSTGSLRNTYLKRYAASEELIETPPKDDLNVIITIPCYNETSLLQTLTSIDACAAVDCSVEVIVIINDAENDDTNIKKQNEITLAAAQNWVKENKKESIDFHIIYKPNLPTKHAGVGLARKIAMDEAVRRFENIGRSDGIIACFDADSVCEKNYLQALVDFYSHHQDSPGCSIYYEHPLHGELDPDNYEAIIDYELFLRFYTDALRIIKFPYAYQTVGSSMAVRSWAYQKQGGMPRRKAGEDFHFINKIIPLGKFEELNNTTIIPSARVSERVPFGTGKAVGDWLKNHQLVTYNPSSFEDLSQLFEKSEELYGKSNTELLVWLSIQPDSLTSFLEQSNFIVQLERINKTSASLSSFKKHFYSWFDAFQCMKFLHYSRDHYHHNVPVSEAASWLLHKSGIDCSYMDNKKLLETFRLLDKKRHFTIKT